jgi:hypothetical protein
MTTVNELRAKFTAREKSVTFVTAGDLLAEHEALSAQLADAMRKQRTTLDDGTTVQQCAERLTALESDLAASTVTVKVRSIGRNAFRRLMAEHASDGEPFDPDMFPPALIAACSLDPVMTVDEVNGLGDVLTFAQWDELFGAAWEACSEVDGVPFSVLASAVTRD